MSLLTNTNATPTVFHLSWVENTTVLDHPLLLSLVLTDLVYCSRYLTPGPGQSQKWRWPEKSRDKRRYVRVPSDYWKRSRDSAQAPSFGQFGVCCNATIDSSDLRTFIYRVSGVNLTLFVFIISPSSCLSTLGNVCLLASLFVFQR